MDKKKIGIIVTIVLIVIVTIYYYFYQRKDIVPDERYLIDEDYCQRDSDCVIRCGGAVNKYYDKSYPLPEMHDCPAVIVFGTKCVENRCQAIYSSKE